MHAKACKGMQRCIPLQFVIFSHSYHLRTMMAGMALNSTIQGRKGGPPSHSIHYDRPLSVASALYPFNNNARKNVASPLA